MLLINHYLSQDILKYTRYFVLDGPDLVVGSHAVGETYDKVVSWAAGVQPHHMELVQGTNLDDCVHFRACDQLEHYLVRCAPNFFWHFYPFLIRGQIFKYKFIPNNTFN